MPLSPGDRLGPYEVVSCIGKGGMGEVWRALDPRLGREVAIKVSALQFTDRFEREARTIASLNHPNICTLFDVGPNYLVMELIEGPTLAERIAPGPIPLEEALGIAKQIGDALEAAHEKGIVHRDLKPQNIKIRPDGSVKVLDFGLAKARETIETRDTTSSSATTLMGTRPGTILGTTAYMSPEQARGQTVDKRADIWAFGVVLYEMLTAKGLFEAETMSDSLVSILTREPDLTLAPEKTRRLLRKCLEKDPRKRLRDISGAELLLEDVNRVTMVQSRPPLAWIAAAGLFALVAGALAFVHFREKPAQVPATRFIVVPPDIGRVLSGLGKGRPPAVSPDGRRIVFPAVSAEGKGQLWLRSLDSLTALPLAGTEDAALPFWSPDSKSIGFFASGKLKRLEIFGERAIALADAPEGQGATWSRDGVILFAPTASGGLQQVPASGGTVRQVTRGDGKTATKRFPWFLPDGRHFLYLVGGFSRRADIRIGSLDSLGEGSLLLDAVESSAVYAQGYMLYVRGSTLVARPFDTKQLAFTGEAVRVAAPVRVSQHPVDLAEFSVSANGVLVYQEGGSNSMRLTWLDRAGRQIGTIGDPGEFSEWVLKLSPDRRTAAVSSLDPSTGNFDIWLYDVMRGLRTRLTSDPAYDGVPVWSPDGRTILFRSDRAGPGDIYRKPVDGSRTEELLYADKLIKNPFSVSPDGRYLAYDARGDSKTGYDLWILPNPLGVPGSSMPRPFLQTEFDESQPQFSPDGHWIAYESNESGSDEVYVAAFPGPGGKRRISTAGGTDPSWRPDGKELFYLSPDHFMAAAVDVKGGELGVHKIETLFGWQNFAFAPSADGQRFLALVPTEGETGAPLVVVQNWTEELKK